jgi:hypothetical protein
MIFDDTNYTDFAIYTCVYMHGLYLWGVLCDKVSCLLHPIAPVAPVPSKSLIIVVDASEADNVATKTADDAVVDAYDQQVAYFSETLFAYHDAQPAYTQWCDNDTRTTSVLIDSVLPSLPLSLPVLVLFLRCGITFASDIIPLVSLSTYL